MIKMKKSAALILAGVLACSMPMPVMASSDTEVVESLLDSGIDFLASDPGKAVDIIMYAKDLVDQQNITDDQVRSAVSRPRQHRHLKRKNSILFLVFLDFPHFFIHSGWQDTLF